MKTLSLDQQHMLAELCDELAQIKTRQGAIQHEIRAMVWPIAVQSAEHCQEMIDAITEHSFVRFALYELLEAFKKEGGD